MVSKIYTGLDHMKTTQKPFETQIKKWMSPKPPKGLLINPGIKEALQLKFKDDG